MTSVFVRLFVLSRGTLEAYVQSVRSRGEKAFAPEYLIMLKVLQAAAP